MASGPRALEQRIERLEQRFKPVERTIGVHAERVWMLD